MKVWTKATAAVLIGAASMAHATVHDHIYGNHFDPITDLPVNANAASRFLTQATFGPTTADIARVMQVGYSEWIDEQLGMPATLSAPAVTATVNARANVKPNPLNSSQTERLNRWWWQATYAPDQLRQRMAFALGQIFVVSDQNSAIGGDIVPMSSYQDMLANGAFALFRQTLEDVTYHPSMGKFLNAFRNTKPLFTQTAPPVQLTSPDENYAREVMQLFSVGLVQLNMDGSVVLSGGVPVPTYDQSVISSTAKIFTGFTYSDAPTGTQNGFYSGGNSFAGASAPMACWGLELFAFNSSSMQHDITGDDGQPGSAKHVLGGQTISGSNFCSVDVGDELDIISAHDNVAPFISSQLIQRFVTSNPSPAYVNAVATVFQNSNGDLGDTLKAILTNSEARNPPAIGSTAEGDTYGKLREPILRVTAIWRAFNAQAQPADTYGEIPMMGGGISLSNFGQNALESPTVFNFYTPDYSQPGVFSDNDLVSPEFQITNESIIYLTANTFYNLTHGSYAAGGSGALAYTGSGATDRPLLKLDSLIYASGSGGTLLTDSQIVDRVNTNLMYGSMSSDMQTKLTNMLHSGMNGAPVQERAWSTIYLTMLSPEFATQR